MGVSKSKKISGHHICIPLQFNTPLAVGGPAGLGSWQTNAGAWAQYGMGGANARADAEDDGDDLGGQEEDDDLGGGGQVDDLDGEESKVRQLKTAIGLIKLVNKVKKKQKEMKDKSETKEYTFRRKGKSESE